MDCPNPKSCDAEAVAVLPDGPLVEILLRVPVKSVCRFKCVSKAWRDLIADPIHRRKLPQTLEGFFLMFDQEDCECGSCGGAGDSDDGDGKHCSADGSDGEEEKSNQPCQGYGFVDVLGTSVSPVDFSFLTELGSIEDTMLLHCCNGLLLFVVDCNSDSSVSYIVCNPATKQYVSVPSSPCFDSGGTWDRIVLGTVVTYLLFEPGASSHFHLVQFSYMRSHNASVYVYSSETRAWSHHKCDWDYQYQRIVPKFPNAYVKGMLHLILHSGKDQLAVVDLKGHIQKIFPLPGRARAGGEQLFFSLYIGQSQGCLHYICLDQKIDSGRGKRNRERLLIWVLQDYDRQQWVLKDTVSFSKLFGRRTCHLSQYYVAGIHPDHSLVYLVQHWDRKLISYHMDSKEVRDLCTLGHGYKCIAPYVPHFSQFGA